MRGRAARHSLALGLLVAGGLLAAAGGGWGAALAAAHLLLAAAVVRRPRSPWPPAWAAGAGLLGPLAAARHWTARLPGACPCARLAHPAPGLLGLTGLAVAADLGVVALALLVTVANRGAEVGK